MNKIVVGPISQGLRNDVLPFNIDNDSFPILVNAYQWRGKVKRKRGTSLLNRLLRYASITTPMASNNRNLIFNAGLEVGSTIVPGSVSIVVVAGQTYTDPNSNGILSGSAGGVGTVNYATGSFAISVGGNTTATFNYYPDLPVMGLEELNLSPDQNAGELAFDTKYSYNINTSSPFTIYDVSFYKNVATGTYTNYVQKTNWTSLTWNGQDYQQFWSCNYQGALWVTNGVNVPFTVTNVGMQYNTITAIGGVIAGPPASATITTGTNHGLVIGDFVFINEVSGMTGINLQTGYVTAVPAANQITVTFPNAVLGGAWTSGGIVQYLTSRSDSTKDCIRWYDGDPTNGVINPQGFTAGKGWVNFCPPLSNQPYTIADLPPAIYYLVGAKMIVPFKDRLLFLGPVVQTSSAGSQVYLQDTIIYCQNGTPYYTASFTGDPLLATTVFNQILVPTNQTATPTAYFEDETGFGGFTSAGISEAITSCNNNKDILTIGFNEYTQAKLVYSGNDVLPFNFFLISSEYGTASTFSAINMNNGTISRSGRGYIITSLQNTDRIDPPIPDEVFQIKVTNNGNERFCSQRDYINQWIYFTYPVNTINYKFPSQTLQYNYGDNSWAIFYENYTTYGTFRKRTGYTWATIGTVFPTWAEWNEPWNAGSSTLLQPIVIAGNQKGFVMCRDDGTGEGVSIPIHISYASPITGATNAAQCVLTSTNNFAIGQQITISGVTGMTELNGNTYTIINVNFFTITINVDSTLFGVYAGGGTATPTRIVYSPNHCLNNNDYIIISNVNGVVSSQVNGKIFSVRNADTNGFNLNPDITAAGNQGGGLVKRMYIPFIQTKQFPVAWDMGRKTRIGPQQYLFTTTDKGQIQLLIYLSQNSASAYNFGPVLPSIATLNKSLIFSNILYTCVESCNLGLTPANTNLQMIADINAAQDDASSPSDEIWHRINTSLVGDTVQIGFTLSDEQMRDTAFKSQFAEIELHGMILNVSPSQMLS